jgi:hypothetical protein
MTNALELYGLLAEFDGPEPLVTAARRVHAEGYRRVDAFTPFPLEELDEALEIRRTRLPWVFFLAGAMGAVGGFFMQWFATVIHYPFNVGGRPLNSWPVYIPVTFELTVLLAGLIGVIAMFARNGLPMFHHPLFGVRRFARATQDCFFLVIEANDPEFKPETTAELLRSLDPMRVIEVPR